MRIATWNLNTWINRKNGIDNSTLWNWADDNLAADLVVFTEAATPPPPAALGPDCVARMSVTVLD